MIRTVNHARLRLLAIANGIRLFTRTGWNSGDTESFAYTEVNDTMAAGGDVSGERWRPAP